VVAQEGRAAYPSEPYSAEITDGHKTGSLDKKGISKYTGIPRECARISSHCSIRLSRRNSVRWNRGLELAQRVRRPSTARKLLLAEVVEVVTAQDGTDGNQSTVTRKQYINMPARKGDPAYGLKYA